MGDFTIEIKGVGGHGCDRNAKEGEAVKFGCGNDMCPDCLTKEFVDKLKAKGMAHTATLTHWPGQEGEVVDDLVEGNRQKGSF